MGNYGIFLIMGSCRLYIINHIFQMLKPEGCTTLELFPASG